MIESLSPYERRDNFIEPRNVPGERDGVDGLSDSEQDVWYILKDIKDPELPHTLGELQVITPQGIRVDESNRLVVLRFTPTVPHCSFSTLIGVAILSALRNDFLVDPSWKVDMRVTPGSHISEAELNRQFSDKERVSAALENPSVTEVIGRMLRRIDS